jgi:hypothetical protein
MSEFFSRYHFLALSLLLGVPAWGIFVLRPDLFRYAGWGALAAMPFALTERFFIPAYWNPAFFGPFFNFLGAGIEDFIFVIHLGWIGAFGHWVVFNRQVSWAAGLPSRAGWFRLVLVILIMFFLFASMLFWQMHPILAMGGSMAAGALLILGLRPPIWRDMVLGALTAGVVYFIVCWIYGTFFPDDFHLVWRTAKLSGIFIAEVPLEEVLYGLGAGALGGGLLPILFGEPSRAR